MNAVFFVVKMRWLWAIAGSIVLLAAGIGGAIFYSTQADAQANAEANQGIAVPILMYHSILKDTRKTNDFIITPTQLENDLKYLSEHGYHTVVIQDLIDYVETGKALPEKPIVLTFDDGHLNNLAYAMPLLEEYGMRAVLSIVGKYTDAATSNGENNVAYSYLTWEQVKQAHDSGVFEIQNHSYALHDLSGRRQGAKQVSGESPDQYFQVLSGDLNQMQERIIACTGVRPTTFAYPFGYISDSSIDIIKRLEFQASLSCEEGINYLRPGDQEKLFCLKRYLRSGRTTTEKIMKKVR